MTKKILILIFSFAMGTSWFYAQGPARERIKTLKVAFITERLNLTSQEAQSFWPIYNEYEETLERIRRTERMELRSQIAFIQDLSNAESSTLLTKFLDVQEEKHEAQLEFISKIKNVISPKKTLLLLKAEEDFKKRLLQQMRKRRGGG
ncbi:Spy/CpxP family protein refolding chaperone [Flagellimonas sp.]|uniref:Spy/CpxP family protein refolding chaperone n=1 Tax=Flagellimonas sp. TaxID=2058762 RepID=UPI003BB01718